MRRRLAAVGLVLVLASCGGDDGAIDDEASTSGDPEAFCERLEELAEDGALDDDPEAAADVFEELDELAPDEIDSDIRRIANVIGDLAALEDEDPDAAFGDALEALFDPALIRSFEAFGAYAEEECGIEGAADELSGGFDTPPGDDPGADPEDDDEPSRAESLRTFLETEYAAQGYSGLVGSIGVGSVSGEATEVTLTLDEIVDEGTALAVCEAAREWGQDEALADMDVEVQESGGSVVALGDLDTDCEAA